MSAEDDDSIDTGPLTKVQLQSLARDFILQLESVAQELWRDHGVASDVHILQRLRYQMCGPDTNGGG